MKRFLLASWLAFAACDDAQPSAESEVAAELRALRAVLVDRGTAGGERAAFDGAQMVAALAPLREAIDALAKHQSELQQRQLSLTQEMQRWSQLLVQSVGGAQRDESQALQGRLQKLEAELKTQEARHREVEALLQKALDSTADRLEDFLKRLGNEGASPPAPAPSTAPPKSVGDAARARRAQRVAAAWTWGTVALVGLSFGAVGFRRWRRERARGAKESHRATEPVAPDSGAQEIWAAAALLGEAVGRLRESTAAGSNGTQPIPAIETASTGDDRGAPHDGEALEFVVLDDELLQGGSGDAAPARPSPVPESMPGPGLPPRPDAEVCRVRAADPARAMAAVLQVLGDDPRVLRRPEPTVRCGRDSVEISFRPLPGLPPGERSHLEQRLRDACA